MVIMRLLLPAVTVWSHFIYLFILNPSPAANACIFKLSQTLFSLVLFKHRHQLTLRNVPLKQTVLLLLAHELGFMQMPADTWSRYRHKGTHTKIFSATYFFSSLLGSRSPCWQTLRLFLTNDLRSLLCKVWFHSGKCETSPGEGSRQGQGGNPYSWASYLHVTLGILSWHSFQPLRCLVPRLFWGFSQPPVQRIGRIPVGHSAWVVPPPHPLPSSTGRRRRQKNARSTMWPLMKTAWMQCLPAADPYSCEGSAIYNLQIHAMARGRRSTDPSFRWDW